MRVDSTIDTNTPANNKKAMATSNKSAPISKRISRNIIWAFLNTAALVKGFRPSSLHRVSAYLDSKFGLRTINSEVPGQRPGTFFPGLRAIPVYETDSFDWADKLERQAEKIRTEFMALRSSGLLTPHPQKLADSGNWNTYYFYSSLFFSNVGRHPCNCPLRSDKRTDSMPPGPHRARNECYSG